MKVLLINNKGDEQIFFSDDQNAENYLKYKKMMDEAIERNLFSESRKHM